MKTGSLRPRVILATLALLAIVLAGVVTAVTLAYRASLEGDLQADRLAPAPRLSAPAPPRAKASHDRASCSRGSPSPVRAARPGQAGREPVTGQAQGRPAVGEGDLCSWLYGVRVDERHDAPAQRRAMAPIDRAVRRLAVVELAGCCWPRC